MVDYRLVRSSIAPTNHTLELLISPGVEINRLDSADMCAHAAVDAGASNADKDTQIP